MLTDREIEMLTFVANGHTDVQIAKLMWLSPRTVKQHVINARKKLGAKTRSHAVLLCYESGIFVVSSEEEQRPDEIGATVPAR